MAVGGDVHRGRIAIAHSRFAGLGEGCRCGIVTAAPPGRCTPAGELQQCRTRSADECFLCAHRDRQRDFLAAPGRRQRVVLTSRFSRLHVQDLIRRYLFLEIHRATGRQLTDVIVAIADLVENLMAVLTQSGRWTG